MPVLYINNRKVDLPDGFKISINKELENFNEPAAVRNSYSVQITLDGTQTNNDIFSSFHLPNAIERVERYNNNELSNLTTTFNPNKKNLFVLLDDKGQVFQRGYVRYDEAVTKGNKTQYKITLFGEMGDVIYNLMYDADGNKKNLANLKYYPFDYPVNTVNGVPNQIDAWDDVRWDAKYIKKIWDESAIYDEERDMYRLQEPKNKYIMPVLTKRGPIDNFDANKITVSYVGMPDVPANSYYSDVMKLMPPMVINPQEATVDTLFYGKSQFEYERDLDFTEVGTVCAQSVTPSFYLPAIIEACCNPDNNGGYTINISPKIKENTSYYRGKFVIMKNLTFDSAPEGISKDINKVYIECEGMNKKKVALTSGIGTSTTYFDFFYPSLYTTWNFGFQLSKDSWRGMYSNPICLNRRQNNNFMFGGVLVRLYVVNKDNNELNHKWYYVTSNNISGNVTEENKDTITNLMRKDALGNYQSIEFGKLDSTLQTSFTNREAIEYVTFSDWQTSVDLLGTNLTELQSPNVNLNLPYNNQAQGNQELGFAMDVQFVGVRVNQITIQGRIAYTSSILTQQYLYGNGGTAVVPSTTNMFNNSRLNPEPDYITNVVLNNRDGDKISKNWNTLVTKKKFFEGTDSPADYLLSLMKLYNLYLISDYTKEKTLNLVTIEEFYNLKLAMDDNDYSSPGYKRNEGEIATVSLDDKVDYSQPVIIQPYIFSKNIDVKPNFPDVDEGSWNIMHTPRGVMGKETEKIFANTNFLQTIPTTIRTKYYNRTNTENTRYWPMPLLPGKYKQYLYRANEEGLVEEHEYERFGIYNNQFVYSKTNLKNETYELKGVNNKGEDADLMNTIVYFNPSDKRIILYDAVDSVVNNSNAANLLGLWSNKDVYGKTILHTVDRYPMGGSLIEIRKKERIITNLNSDIQQTVTLYVKMNLSNIDELFRKIYEWQNNLYIITKCENITIGGEQPIKITMVRIPYKNFVI